MSDEKRICPMSGVELHRDIRPAEISYGGRSETVMLPGWYPPEDCEEGADSIHTGSDMRVSDEALKRLKAQAKQKAYTISDMTEEERLELADTIETELESIESKSITGKHNGIMDDDIFEMLEKDIASGNVQDIDPEMIEKMKLLTADVEVDLDEPIHGDVVISSSGNVFEDLGLENADELKKTAEKMIADGVAEDQIVSVLKATLIVEEENEQLLSELAVLETQDSWCGDPRDMIKEDIEFFGLDKPKSENK